LFPFKESASKLCLINPKFPTQPVGARLGERWHNLYLDLVR